MDREITITVTDDEARRIDERVASGEFESAADVVRAALANYDGLVQPLPDAVLLHLIDEELAIGGEDVDDRALGARLDRQIIEMTAKRNARA